MRLRTKIGSAVSTVVALYAAFDYDVQRTFIYPQFLELERDEARQDVERCREAIVQEIDQLTALCGDLASLKNVRSCFAEEVYEQDALASDIFRSDNIDLAYVYRKNGEFLWGKVYMLEPSHEVQLKDFDAQMRTNNLAFITHHSLSSAKRGIILTELGPMLVASLPIRSDDPTSPIGGTLVVGQLLSKERLANLSHRIRLPLTIAIVGTSVTSPLGEPVLRNSKSLDEPVLLELDERTMAGFCHLRDIHGTPALRLRTVVDRNISLRAQTAMNFASASLLAGGGLVLIVLLLLIQRIVVAPISSLTTHATAIGASGDLSLRIESASRDETGALAAEFNRMVDRLAESSRRLMDLSRQAGMAQIASSVLHNVGNVLASVTCVTDSLRRTLHESRMGRLRQLSDMLDAHVDDVPRFIAEDPRGKQVLPYIRQLASRWDDENARLTADVATLTVSVQHIVTIVDAQQQYATRTRVTEPVEVAGLIHDAVQLCEQGLRRHGIVLRQDLEERLPPVVVDRARSLEVLVNLITNSRESLCDAGSEQPTIDIVTRRRFDEGVRIEVIDNGGGIGAENLTRLFHEGFTTKPDGHGFGLHFCALAVKEMGGSISARSEGVGMGAAFVVDLPCETAHLTSPIGAGSPFLGEPDAVPEVIGA